MSRAFYFGLAWVFVGLGFAGIFLPLVPTTPFLLVALWGFVRSSPRFEVWLRGHSILGPYVNDWTEYGIVPVKAKILSVSTMGASLAWLAIFSKVPTVVVVITAICLAGVAAWLLSRPSKVPVED